MMPKRPAPRHIIIKMPKIKYKERILKSARETQLVAYKLSLIRLSAESQKKLCGLKETGKKYSK